MLELNPAPEATAVVPARYQRAVNLLFPAHLTTKTTKQGHGQTRADNIT